jgi:hypothetical protein
MSPPTQPHFGHLTDRKNNTWRSTTVLLDIVPVYHRRRVGARNRSLVKERCRLHCGYFLPEDESPSLFFQISPDLFQIIILSPPNRYHEEILLLSGYWGYLLLCWHNHQLWIKLCSSSTRRRMAIPEPNDSGMPPPLLDDTRLIRERLR